MAVEQVIEGVSGPFTAASGTSFTIDLSSTPIGDVGNAFLMFTQRENDTLFRSLRHRLRGTITDANTLTFTRNSASSAADIYIAWTVVEFVSGDAQIISGSFAATTDPDTETLPGSASVDPTYSFVVWSWETDLTTQLQFARAYLDSSTSVGFDFSVAPGTNDFTIGYQVVELLTGCVGVDYVNIAVNSPNASNTATISTVDPDKTFIVEAGATTNFTGFPFARNRGRLVLTDSTTVTADRTLAGTEPNLAIGGFVVEMSDDTVVHHGSYSIADTSASPASAPTFTETTNGSVIAGWPLGNLYLDDTGATSGVDDALATVALDDPPDGLTITRTGTAAALYGAYFVVDWAGAGGGPVAYFRRQLLLGVG